jgi:hypothetical protein
MWVRIWQMRCYILTPQQLLAVGIGSEQKHCLRSSPIPQQGAEFSNSIQTSFSVLPISFKAAVTFPLRFSMTLSL